MECEMEQIRSGGGCCLELPKAKAIQVQVEHRFCWEWKKIFAKSVTKKNPCLPSTFSSKMPQFEMFIYFRNFLKKYLVTPYSSKGSGPENINRSSSFFSLIEKNSRHISSPIFSWFSILQRISRRKNWKLTKLFKAKNPTKIFGRATPPANGPCYYWEILCRRKFSSVRLRECGTVVPLVLQ